MFKKLYNKLFKKKSDESTKVNEEKEKTIETPTIINEHTIKGVIYKLGDKVICRSNECGPLMIGTIIEWWDNNGKWTHPIPQIKDDLDGQVWSHMGTVVHYTDELFTTLEPMRPLEQWNYLLPDNVKEIHSYSVEDMDRKERLYERSQQNKITTMS